MKTKKLFLIILCCVSFSGTQLKSETRTSGARFLALGAGAKESAMGSAYSSLTNDVNAIYWNPAGLSRMQSAQLSGSHSQLFLDTQYDFIGFAIPTSQGTIGVSGTYLNSGKQDGRTEMGTKSGDFSAVDTAFSLAYARNLNTALNLGTNIKFVESRIGPDHANTVGFDVGGQLKLYPALWAGMAVRNMGSGLKYISQEDPLPLTIVTGLGKKLFSGFIVTGEWQHEPRDSSDRLVFGSEYQLGALALRGGFLSNMTGSTTKNSGLNEFFSTGGLVGGFGLRLARFNLDYAFTPFGQLGETHRFTLAFNFDVPGSQGVSNSQQILFPLEEKGPFK